MMVIGQERKLDTRIWLPPGELASARLRKTLRLFFGQHAWFKPKKIGEGPDAIPLPEDARIARIIDRLVRFYEKNNYDLLVAGPTHFDQLLFMPNRFGRVSYTGSITWCAHVRSARKPAWRDAHVEQVAQLMRMLDAPYATASLIADMSAKTHRFDPRPEGGTELRLTTLGYDEGLVGLVWRNFFGPPLVRLFGDRLKALPPERARDLGGIWLVEPYDSPELAGTDEARARERELIQILGPECFYDQERDTKATRTLDLPVLDDQRPPPPREVEAHQAAVQKRLDEHWAWARRRWEDEGAIVRTTGEGYLLLSSGPVSLTKAVLDWGLSHTEDPLFLKRTPDEVAAYLEAKGEVPHRPIHPDARAELARIRSILGDEGFDALAGLLPAMRDVETALKGMAGDGRVEALRKLSELLTFVPGPRGD